MKLLDFSTLNGWPGSASTWKFVQEQMLQLQLLSLLGGTNYIVSGCTVTGGNVSDGVVVVNGEVLPFVGGAAQTYVVVNESTTSRKFKDNQIRTYYKNRSAGFGTAATRYAWADFERNDPSNGALKRLRLAETLLTSLSNSLTTLATTVDTKADKSNVLELNNTDAYEPETDYNPATKKYVDNGLGCKLAFAGTTEVVSGSWVVTTSAGTLTLTVARQDTGNYRISHNLGHSNYFITGLGKGLGLGSPRSYTKSDNYFDIYCSDDASPNDIYFYFQIFTY